MLDAIALSLGRTYHIVELYITVCADTKGFLLCSVSENVS